MSVSPTLGIAPSASLARLLASLSLVLLVVFLAEVFTTTLPPKLLDPQWQLALIAALINNAFLALVGCLLLPLALWFDPNNHRLSARNKAFRRWALAAVLGFVLLVPLQGYAAWKFYKNVTVTQEQQTTQSSRKLSELRQAIASSSTHQDLQAKVQKLFGRNAGLSPSELRTPMPELRQQLLARAEQASSQLMQQIEAQATMKPDRLLKETIRIVISAVAYAIGFAFLTGVLPRRKGAGRSVQPGVDDHYFQKLAK